MINLYNKSNQNINAGWTTIYESGYVASDASGFNISGILPSFAHLKAQLYLRSDVAAVGDDIILGINGGATAYFGAGSILSSGPALAAVQNNGQTVTTQMGFLAIPGASAPAGYFGFLEIDIPDCSSTNNKVILWRVLGTQAATNAGVRLGSGGSVAPVTAPVNNIFINPLNGGVWKAGSRLTIYGLPGIPI